VKVDLVSDLVAEVLEGADRFDREADVCFAGELVADAASIGSRSTRTTSVTPRRAR
jgi:hypothetical protein